MEPALPAFTLIVVLPSAPVTPLPVATPDNVTVAPFTARSEVWFLTVKFTLVGIPTVTDTGLALMVNTGVTGAGFAVTVVVLLVYPDMLAVAVMEPALPACTLIVVLPSAPVTPLPVATPVRVTVAPFTARPEVWFLTVKFTLVGIPTVTDIGLAFMVNTGVTGAGFAVTVVVLPV